MVGPGDIEVDRLPQGGLGHAQLPGPGLDGRQVNAAFVGGAELGRVRLGGGKLLAERSVRIYVSAVDKDYTKKKKKVTKKK